MAEKLSLTMGRANLDEFAATLQELAKANRNIIAVTSDSRGSGKLGPFGQALPKQLVEVGIAEFYQQLPSFDPLAEGDEYVSFLPFAWIGEQMMSMPLSGSFS